MKLYLIVLFAICILFNSCTKEIADSCFNVTSALTLSTPISFSPCSFNGESYTWNFGDGTPSVTTSGGASHLYLTGNNHTVTLTVTNGSSVSYSSKTISLPSMTATLTANSSSSIFTAVNTSASYQTGFLSIIATDINENEIEIDLPSPVTAGETYQANELTYSSASTSYDQQIYGGSSNIYISQITNLYISGTFTASIYNIENSNLTITNGNFMALF